VILIDTAIWIDHLRSSDAVLVNLLEAEQVLSHPFVIGEIALGTLRQRDQILAELHDLPQAEVATDREVLQFIGRDRLFGLGIGYIDAHLLASTRLTPDALLWTRDRRLRGVANKLGLAAEL